MDNFQKSSQDMWKDANNDSIIKDTYYENTNIYQINNGDNYFIDNFLCNVFIVMIDISRLE